MGRLLILCAAVLACTAIGSAFQCYKCGFTIFNIPCITSKVNCSDGELCGTIQGSAVGKDLIKRKGCIPKENCGKNSTETYLKIDYTTTTKCCDGDLCNTATTLSSAHFSLSMALAMLGFWCTQLLL